MSNIYLKPAEGLTVPRLDGSSWPVVGDWTESDAYVRRRLKAGDLVAAEPPAEAADGAAGETPTEPETASASKRRASR
ncbi:DUF2635 domain-containing protein [Azorhizobium doebereinerae]|uniref:DUF2635 domain-containing protein n=1 Tax=Azorhizobium doebereinerae TaxID=281091 RepID=UPI000406ACAE|nr:DUF2635 domain-containing protein [Azorhizobium doebereinerae]